MNLGDWLKRMFSSRPESAAEEAAEREEYGAPDVHAADLEGDIQARPGAGATGLAAEEEAEAAEANLQEFEPPPDPAP
jgi:hypothetical protein